MAYETIDAYNTSEGLHVLLYYVEDIVPGFIAMVLAAFWIISVFGSFFAQKRISGTSSMKSSVAAGSYATAILAIIISLIPNLIRIETLVTAIGVSILATIWLFIPEDNGL